MQILTWPHPALRTAAETVAREEVVTAAFHERCDELARVLVQHKGLGLAATQVGWMQRVLVFVQKDPEGELGVAVLVNPQILNRSERTIRDEEGCLSFPGMREWLHAPASVTVRYITLDGETREDTWHAYEARCLFHECEHLAGRTLIDRMSSLQRRMFLKAYGKRKVAA